MRITGNVSSLRPSLRATENKKKSDLPQTDLSTVQEIREVAWKKTKIPKMVNQETIGDNKAIQSVRRDKGVLLDTAI